MKDVHAIQAALAEFLADIRSPLIGRQLAVLLTCVGLAWLVACLLKPRIATTRPRWQFSVGSLNRVVFPLLALGFIAIARELVVDARPARLLDLALPLLGSLALDGFGWLGVSQEPLTPAALLGAASVVVGAALIVRGQAGARAVDGAVGGRAGWLTLALLAGAVLPIQGAVNGQLRADIDAPATVGALSFLVAAAAMALVLAVSLALAGGPSPRVAPLDVALGGLRGVPWWGWLGGLCGASYVTSVFLLIPEIGTAATIALTVAGQQITSLFVDRYGLLRLPQRPLSAVRLAGVGTLLAGVAVIQADEFVLCAGIWSSELARELGLRLPMQAGKGYSLTVEKGSMSARRCAILSEARAAMTPMGGMLRFGGTMEITDIDETVDRARVRGIAKSIGTYFPEMTPEVLARAVIRTGLRPCSPDGLPYVGRFSRFANLSAATGHAMMGVSLAPITGTLIAEVLSGERTSIPIAALSPDRYARSRRDAARL